MRPRHFIMNTLTSCVLLLLLIVTVGCKKAATTTTKAQNLPWDICYERPSAPIDMLATAGDGQVSLTWSLNSKTAGCKLEIHRWQVGTSPSLYKELPPGTTSFTDTGLTNGTRYFYLVVTKDKRKVMSLCSANTWATPVAPPPVVVYDDSSSSASDSNGSDRSPYADPNIMQEKYQNAINTRPTHYPSGPLPLPPPVIIIEDTTP